MENEVKHPRINAFWSWTKQSTKAVGVSLITWSWTKKLLYWMIISAGTMAECMFLLASLWMSLNSSVHKLILMFMSEQVSLNVSSLATAAYVALPECILGLAFVTVIAHVRVWWYDRSNKAAIAWSILYGLPTIIFLVLSLITLGFSVASTEFIMPTYLVIIRALAGYMFAFTSLLYTKLGEPQEADRLRQKDELIAELRHESAVNLSKLRQENAGNMEALRKEKDALIADLQKNNDVNLSQLSQQNKTLVEDLRHQNDVLAARIEIQKTEIENQKALLEQTKNAQSKLIEAAQKSDEAALQGLSEECLNWLKSGVKTVSPDEITRYTGISKRKIDGAITRGNLQTSPRNKELILVSSLVNWLKSNAQSTIKTDDVPVLHLVNG